MSAFSNKLAQMIPEANVVGKLADQPGYLIQLPSHFADTNHMITVQESLLTLGIQGWNWRITRDHVKVRAYTAKQRKSGAMLVLAALAVLAALLYCGAIPINDVHGIAKAFGLGSHS